MRSSGPNVFATTLGRGWYSLPVDAFTRVLGYSTFGNRTLRVAVSVDVQSADGAVARWTGGTGAGWKHSQGPIVTDHLFLGEVYDARRETPGWTLPNFDDTAWTLATVVTALPVGANRLEALQIPPIRQLDPMTPVSVSEVPPGSGVYIFDLGSNFAGICAVRVEDTSSASAGDVMTVRHAETVDDNGVLVQNWLLGNSAENSTYIFRGDDSTEIFQPSFSYFGFRFVEVVGFPSGRPPLDAVTCRFTHTDLGRGSSFETVGALGSGGVGPASLLNGIQGLILRSALSNYHSHPTDCPSREKVQSHAAPCSVFVQQICRMCPLETLSFVLERKSHSDP
jgi:alpha-L-rhamnosidase